MRRFLLGAVVVGGCFNPMGNDSAGPTTTGATTTASATTATGSGTNPTTGIGTTTGGTTTGVTTTGVTTTGVTTTGTTATTDPSTTSTGSTGDSTTMTDGICDPPCGPCQTCKQGGVCFNEAKDVACEPPAGGCQGIVWGELAGSCYEAEVSVGVCDGQGGCKPVCGNQGVFLLKCADEACLRPDHACQPGVLASSVTIANLCATGGAMTSGCTSLCNQQDALIQSFGCDNQGACELGLTQPCEPFNCDPQALMCYEMCFNNTHCAPGHECNMTCTKL